MSRGHAPRRLLTDPSRVPVKICQTCLDLPWRREAVCEECRLPFAEEAPVTLEEQLALPVYNTRTDR